MVVGLTGGIGSGKSTVARLFELLGYPVFNSDMMAKQLYFYSEIKKQVEDLLGKEAYVSDHQINKAYIASKIFSNTDLLHRLNSIIHPAVKEEFLKFLARHPDKTVIKETALLFEAGLEKDMEKIVMVTAPDELRIRRVMERDNVTREEVISKIKSQLPQEEKLKRAHYVIKNNEQEFLVTQVLALAKQLPK